MDKNVLWLRSRTVISIAILLIGAVTVAGCGSKGPSNPLPPPPENNFPPSPQYYADLTVSRIEVFPAQPKAGQRFTLNIYVQNAGQASSGAYDLAVSLKNTSRNLDYPIGTFRKQMLRPGENVAVFASQDVLVNEAGSFQALVEIKPFDFRDGNDQNNIATWAFTVQ
jgi:predicted small lipoprotein YifL